MRSKMGVEMGSDLMEIFEGNLFEESAIKNGKVYWLASNYIKFLDYKDLKEFKGVIDKAMKTMLGLNIDWLDNIIPIESEGKRDYQLSRFACYLLAMNGDSSKQPVAEAQVYFATMTRGFEEHIECSQDVDRVAIREELKVGNKQLSSTIHKSGIKNYARFANAGYLGMYNMINIKLANKRQISKDKLLDHMGTTELAANQFRVIMTEERIRTQNIKGQSNLEKAHKSVAEDVRHQVKKNTGVYPENLPVYEIINVAKKHIKQDKRKLLKMDKDK